MNLRIRPSRIKGNVSVPGSKSHTVRGVAAALLAEGTSNLRFPLLSADTLSVLHAAEQLGASAERTEDSWKITGTGGKLHIPETVIDLGNSGTGLRILTAVASLAGKTVAFDGDSSLRTRVMKGELDSLSQAGVQCVSRNGFAPLSVTGPMKGGNIHTDGTTSQFLTALLMSLPLAENDSEITLDFLNEGAYIGITLEWLKLCGIRIEVKDALHYHVPGKQQYHAFDRAVPADFSTAAFPLAAALTAGEGVRIGELDFSDPQGDKQVFEFFRQAGGMIENVPGGVTVKPSSLHGCTFDLNGTPDALPVMAVIGALSSGVTRLVNVPQARLKETDRISAMAHTLSQMGADITELPDGLVIRGGKKLHGTTLSGYGDHRIIMSLAVAAMSAEGETIIENAEAFSVTWPGFLRSFRSMGADIQEV